MEYAALTRLDDMLAMADAIAALSADGDLALDRQTRLAVERCLEIAAVASRHVPEEKKRGAPEVPWSEIATFDEILTNEGLRVSVPKVRRMTATLLAVRPAIVALAERRPEPSPAAPVPAHLDPHARQRWLAEAEAASRRLKDDLREQMLLDEIEAIQTEKPGPA